MAELLKQVYGDRLKTIILYGSVARGAQTEGSDVDIMVLIDGTDAQLREYDERLSDVSTDMALKYMTVFSIIDVKYQEYQEWKTVSPFYKNVDQEGVVVYAALEGNLVPVSAGAGKKRICRLLVWTTNPGCSRPRLIVPTMRFSIVFGQ